MRALPRQPPRGASTERTSLGSRALADTDMKGLRDRAILLLGFAGAFRRSREKTKTTVIARKLKRTLGATHQKAMRLGVTLGAGRGKREA